MPIVSVIVPVHNAKSYIKASLACLLNQDLQDYEVILVDDGSTDGSTDIIESLVGSNSKFRLVKQENRGAGAARNTGLRMAKGRYLAFLDADDLFDREMLSSMSEALESSGADVCVCEADRCDASGYLLGPHIRFPKAIQERVYAGGEVRGSLFQTAKGCPWNKLYRADFIRDLGLEFQEISNCNDSFFVCASLVSCDAICLVKRSYVTYRVGTGSSLQDRRAKDPTCPLLAAERLWEWAVGPGHVGNERLPAVRAWCGTLAVGSVEQAVLANRFDEIYPAAKACLVEWDTASLDGDLFPSPSVRLAAWAISRAVPSGIRWAYGDRDISRFGTKAQKVARAGKLLLVGLAGDSRS